MRILYVLPYYPFSLRSGSSLRASNIIKRLSAVHELHIVCLGVDVRDDPAVGDIAKACASMRVVPHTISRVSSALRSLATFQPYDIVIHKSRLLAPVLRERVDEIEPDCVIFSRFGLAPYVLSGTGIPQIIDQHDLSSAFWRLASTGGKRRWFRAFSRLNLRFSEAAESKWYPKFDAVIGVSEHELNLTRRYLMRSAQTLILPNGADTDYYTNSGRKPQKNLILFTGSMNAQRNIDAVENFAEKILPLIVSERPEVLFQVVGHSPSNAVKRLSTSENIEIVGEVKDTRPYLEAATVVVAPFLSGSGLKHKVPIAMSMSKAVVATSNACQGLQVSHGEHLLMAESPQEFSQAVLQVLDGPQLREKLGKNARTFVIQNFSWDELVSQLSIWLEEVSSVWGTNLQR